MIPSLIRTKKGHGRNENYEKNLRNLLHILDLFFQYAISLVFKITWFPTHGQLLQCKCLLTNWMSFRYNCMLIACLLYNWRHNFTLSTNSNLKASLSCLFCSFTTKFVSLHHKYKIHDLLQFIHLDRGFLFYSLYVTIHIVHYRFSAFFIGLTWRFRRY